MVAWYEFLCGCTEEEERIGKAILTGGVLAFAEAEAQEAVRLFRDTGRSRGLRVDAMENPDWLGRAESRNLSP